MSGRGAHGSNRGNRRRGRGEGGIRQRPDGRWEATIDLGAHGAKRIRRFIYGRTRKEVTDKLKAEHQRQEDGAFVTGRMPTVAQFLDAWLASAQQTVRSKTYVSYEGMVRLHIKPWIGKARLDKLTAVDVQGLVTGRAAEGQSTRVLQYRLQVLRIALNKAVRWGLVTRNVAAFVDGPRVEPRHGVFLSREQAARFLDAAREDALSALYTVALSIGLRQGEALGLSWSDVDFDGRVVNVQRQLQRVSGEGFGLVELKTARSRRRVRLPEACLAALRRHRVEQQEFRLMAGPDWMDSGLVFTNAYGRPLHGSTVTKQLQRLLREAGLPRMRFHDLRHSAASLLLVQGVPLRVVMEVLGHSRIAVTSDIYTHVVPSLLGDAADTMDAALGGQFGGQENEGDVEAQ